MESAQRKLSGIAIATFGAVAALFSGLAFAECLVYLLVPIGAALSILGAIGASMGKIEKDF